MRLFVALELPGSVRDALALWAADALSRHPEVRRLGADHLHVTLCFLGWQSEDAVGEIVEACRGAAGVGPAEGAASSPAGGAAGLSQPALRIDEAIWLPPRRPRVLAVRLAEEGGRVLQLQSHLSGQLEQGGWYVPERRPFLPHVTVARVGARTAMRPFSLPSPPPLSFPASRITLFRSRLSSGGARYEALASVEWGLPPA